jgi:hypothetical protein
VMMVNEWPPHISKKKAHNAGSKSSSTHVERDESSLKQKQTMSSTGLIKVNVVIVWNECSVYLGIGEYCRIE